MVSIRSPKDTLQPGTSSSWKIGIVSSDSHHVGAVAAILLKQGLEPICALTVNQYKDALSKQAIGPVFCDQKLPDGDYSDVINASRAAGSRARVVMTFPLTDWSGLFDTLRAGAFDAISKPCEPRDVEWMVDKARRDDRKMATQPTAPNAKSRARGAA